MSAAPIGTREISRHAVRAELARVAFNRFCLTGFNQVTFADLSKAAGVSRSTFLRYFGTKEDVVLFVFDPSVTSSPTHSMPSRPTRTTGAGCATPWSQP